MSKTIVVDLPDQVEAALTEPTREEGLSPSELIKAGLDDCLFLRKFRRLRERMLAQAQEALTDDDVSERVS